VLTRSAFVLIALIGLWPVGARAEEPQSAYREATRLAAEGRWAEAAEQFRAALAVRETAAGRFNLAQAERNVGRFATAKSQFVRARELAIRDGAEDVRTLAEHALAALARRIPKLLIELPPGVANADARVDTKPVEIGTAIELDPGRHRVVVVAAGNAPFERSLALADGQTLRLVVTFAPRERAPEKPAPRAPPRLETDSSGPPVGAVLLAGIGAAAFTTAALLHVRRNDKLEEASQDCERRDGGFVCPASLENDREHHDLVDSADRAELGRDIAIGLGVGAWTAGALWWLLDRGGGERTLGASIGPGRRGAALRMHVRF
jgi:tetratricopeptide (TPR) repeat protein